LFYRCGTNTFGNHGDGGWINRRRSSRRATQTAIVLFKVKATGFARTVIA
jgi:hypothetical protein